MGRQFVAGARAMADKWVVIWLAVEARAPIGVWPMMPRQEQKAFDSQKSAVSFVMEELEESRRPNAQLSTADGTATFDFDAIKQMYAAQNAAES